MRTITKQPPPIIEIVLSDKEAEFLHCLTAGLTASMASGALIGTKLEGMRKMEISQNLNQLFSNFTKKRNTSVLN